MSSESHARAKEGLIACLRDLGNGYSRLIFDDVVADFEGKPTSWSYKAHYTWNAYENNKLDDMALSDDEYKDIGIAVVARLLAINGRVK